jgi:hypothetical protein
MTRKMKNIVLRNVTLCSVVKIYRRFGGTCWKDGKLAFGLHKSREFHGELSDHQFHMRCSAPLDNQSSSQTTRLQEKKEGASERRSRSIAWNARVPA